MAKEIKKEEIKKEEPKNDNTINKSGTPKIE